MVPMGENGGMRHHTYHIENLCAPNVVCCRWGGGVGALCGRGGVAALLGMQ